MKFNDKHPELTNPQRVYPERPMGPHPEIEVEPGVIQSWRIYPCGVCKAPTGWRSVLYDDIPPACCCSEECMIELKACQLSLENPAPNAEGLSATSATTPAVPVNEPVMPDGLQPIPTK